MDAALLEWCRRLIECRSVTTEGTRRIAELCAAELLAPAGITARLVASEHEGPEQVNLIAIVRGRDPSLRPLLLNTHLDTVPPGTPELWTACAGDPFRAHIDGDRIYGLGAADTKLDFAAKVFALKAAGKPRREVCLIGSFGEEHGLVGAKELATAGILPSGALAFVGEPSRLEVITAHKGLMAFELELRFTPARSETPARLRRIVVEGKAAHSSTPALGVNAIVAALKSITASPGRRVAAIFGGSAVNVVPARCELTLAAQDELSAAGASATQAAEIESSTATEFIPTKALAAIADFVAALGAFADRAGSVEPDYAPPTLTSNPGMIRSERGALRLEFELRPPPGLTLDAVRQGLGWLVDELARANPDLRVELIEKRANPGFRAPAASETVELAMGALATAGLPLRAGVKSGCTEAGIYAAAGLEPVVIGPGPSTGVIHAPNEYNFLSEVDAAVRFYRALLAM
ncbi:MAG TPA: M20/M25/M40 family metallo-hydrolase [Candidatus Binataceae bacterium]|nr:M20/M25/M40 family metallo-hydrolase [Candidatus Binataceae bacterium]